MTSPEKFSLSEHPEESLLLYLEGQLSPERRHQVENHVRTCPRCAAELEKLDFAITSLKAHKEAFCPEPWEIYEFVRLGRDPDGGIARHVEQCALCREDIALCQPRGETADTPESVRTAFVESFPVLPAPAGSHGSRRALSALVDVILSALNHPVAALGYAAAAVILVILVYPHGETPPIPALSRVTWAEVDAGPTAKRPPIRLKLMGRAPKGSTREGAKPRVAALILLKGFPRPMPQENIDDLYRSLKPTRRVDRRYSMITPAQVSDAVASIPRKLQSSEQSLLNEIGSRLGAVQALLLTVTATQHRYVIEGELARTSDGKSLGRTIRRNVTKTELAAQLREAALELLGERDTQAVP